MSFIPTTSLTCIQPHDIVSSLPQNPGISILGDSISTLSGVISHSWRCFYQDEACVEGITSTPDTWWGRVIESLGGHLVANSSFSGSTMEGAAFPAGCSSQRISALSTNDSTPDIVFIYIGINDFGWGGARNQILGGSVSASGSIHDLKAPYTFKDTIGVCELELFKAAYTSALKQIRSMYPLAHVYCISLLPCTHTDFATDAFIYSPRGVHLSEYNACIAQAAAQTESSFVDIASFKRAYQSVDGLHPNARGMKEIAALVLSCISENDPDAACSSNTFDYLDTISAMKPALQSCSCTTCHGCPHNTLTHSRWSLQCAARHL